MMGKAGKTALLIFLGTYCVYEANVRPIASDDSFPNALLPMSILSTHTLQLDRFAPVLQTGRNAFYCLREKNHHFYSKYPMAQPLLLTPLYVPVWLIARPERWNTEKLIWFSRFMEKIMAGAVAAASAAFLFLLLDRLTSRWNALALTAAFAFGTTMWAIASQAMWQHTPGVLVLVLAALTLERWSHKPESMRLLFLAGLWSGLAAAVRTPNIFFAGAVVVGLLLRRATLQTLAIFLAPVAVLNILNGVWNLWLFNDLRGYAAVPLGDRPIDGLIGLLFSPGRGLLIYCPVLIFAVAGLIAWRKGVSSNLSLLLVVSVLFCGATLALMSEWQWWWGGHCWGPRLLTEMTPFLTLLMIPAMDRVMSNRGLSVLFGCLLLYSASIEFVGTFFYPKGGWDDLPGDSDRAPERFWDWADNPVRRSLQGGFAGEPYTVLLEAARHGQSAAAEKIRASGYKGF